MKKEMKYFSKAAVFVVAATMMVGCEKDNPTEVPEGAMMLSAEGFSGNGSKTSVSDETVQWVAGDVVNINGTDYTVGISGDGKAYTTSTVTSASTYYGYYPGSIVKNDGQSTTPTVTLPSRYHSSYSGGRQVLALPMAAYNNGATETLKFKHLTAAVKVTVKNSTGFNGLYIDSVQVVSATQNLCGDVTLTLTDENYSLSAATGSNNTVTVYFDRESVQIDNNATLEVQVPILPIASAADDLTVKVYSHNKAPIVLSKPGIAPANYDFNYVNTHDAPALARNVMSAANVAVTNGTEHTTTVDHGLFTINASGGKVHFSQGNLQRINDTWQFASHQYDVLGSWSSTSCDLFFWETTGNYGSGQNCETSSGTSSDVVNWGDNAISNGGNVANAYSTPSTDNWQYLFNSRSGYSSKYGSATVCSQHGVVILPDHWTLPTGCSFTSGMSGWSTNSYDATAWAKMEAAGAVFLPAAGYRYGSGVNGVGDDGNYWSSTACNDLGGSALHVNFHVGGVFLGIDIPGGVYPGFDGDRDYGMSVRLVCE